MCVVYGFTGSEKLGFFVFLGFYWVLGLIRFLRNDIITFFSYLTDSNLITKL